MFVYECIYVLTQMFVHVCSCIYKENMSIYWYMHNINTYMYIYVYIYIYIWYKNIIQPITCIYKNEYQNDYIYRYIYM